MSLTFLTMKVRLAVAASITLLVITTSQCTHQSVPDVYAPIGSAAEISGGDLFALESGKTFLVDSPASVWLWMEAHGRKDFPAMESMIKSGRVIFVPYGTRVDVLEHDRGAIATKVHIRGGANIGREVWTHPKYVAPVK